MLFERGAKTVFVVLRYRALIAAEKPVACGLGGFLHRLGCVFR